MDKAAKSQFEKQTIKYIEDKKIYDVLENLLRKLALNQPNDPIDFLIDQLSHKKPNFIISILGTDVDIHKACENISLQLNLKRICADELITKEIQNGTALGKDFQKTRSQSERISEEKVFPLVLQELKSVDKFVNGVLLENFPRTLQGAECLKENKTVIERIFAISEETIEEKFKQKKYTHELLDIKDLLESFGGFVVNLDAKGKPSEKVSEEIVTMLNYRVKHTIPLRPPRILVVNPPGVSFEKIGAQIAQKFGLVHIDGTTLLNDEINNKTRIGAIISDCFQKNNLVPDDLLCGLVYNQLTKSTSRILGWVLTSFPLNPAQFHKYTSWELHPHFVLSAKIKEDVFSKTILETGDVGDLNYFGQVFVNKSRKNKQFFDEYLTDFQKVNEAVEKAYPNKVEAFEIETNSAQLGNKVGKLLQNPVYYE